MNANRFIIIGLILVALFSAQAPACSVPVFRYALNYWQGDEYELQAHNAKFPSELSINLRVTPGDSGNTKLLLDDREIWSGKMTADTLPVLLDSPVRREMAKRILHGDSVVWIMVESGNADKDDEAANTLSKRLRYLESIAILPEMRPDDPQNRLGPGPTLAIRHSLIRVSRKDPLETFTLAMLDRDHHDATTPILYPIFGRGRVLVALPQEKLTRDNIDEVCQFLTSSCSCEVKDKRIGWDLLVQCDWEEELTRAEQQRRAQPAEPTSTTQPAVHAEVTLPVVQFTPETIPPIQVHNADVIPPVVQFAPALTSGQPNLPQIPLIQSEFKPETVTFTAQPPINPPPPPATWMGQPAVATPTGTLGRIAQILTLAGAALVVASAIAILWSRKRT